MRDQGAGVAGASQPRTAAPNCGCRISRAGTYQEGVLHGDGGFTPTAPAEPIAPRIVYCPTHEAAFRLADALEGEWEMNHAEMCTNMPHKDGDVCHYPRPALLREIGR